MFNGRAEAELTKEHFKRMGWGITAVGRIGDQIEWYYLDTRTRFQMRDRVGERPRT